MRGVAEFRIMSALPILRQFRTGTRRLRRPRWPRRDSDACDTNVSEVAWVASPNDPNIGRYRTGCGVGMEAFASPIMLQAMNPPLITSSGLTPKNAGLHRTRSANFPGSTEPISCDTPCAIAGLIVYF